MGRFFNRRGARPAKFLVMAVMWLAFIAAVVGLVMTLWNWLMPALFAGARPIDYGQAFGLLVLCKILFGGHGRGRWREHHHRRLEGMTPEERERFQRRFHGRWGRWGGPCGGGAEGPAKTSPPSLDDTPPRAQ